MAVPGGPGYPGGYAPQPKVRLEVFGEAWKLVQPNLGTWIGATIVYLVCIIAVNVVVGVVAGRSMAGNGIGSLLGSIVGFFLQCGMSRMAIKQVRGERVEIADMFSVTDVIGSIVIGSILYSLLTLIGLVLCILPGLVLIGLLMFMPLFIVDQRMDATTALSTSINALKTDVLMATLFVFVAGILVVVSAIPCGIGLLFTVPVYFVSIALLYRDFFPSGGPTYPGVGPVYSAPPTEPGEPPVQG